jgi:hypothetical protein
MKKAGTTPSASRLESARNTGDAPADALVADLGSRVWAVNALMREVRRNRDPLPAAVPEDVRAFLTQQVAPPPWLNRTRVLNAQCWAERHVFHITVALFCASLPSAYAAERGARVLAVTGRMAGDLDRRVNETARFILEVLKPGSLDSEGGALPAVRKVRLMHAAVRTLIRDRAEFAGEVPINQEDMLGTLLGFSVVVLRAVKRLGIEVDASTAEDFYHLWRGIGAMLGIEEDLLPGDFAAASRAADLIAERQFRSSEHGRALMTALLARTEAHVDLPGIRETPAFLVRYLLGDQTADLLGVKPPALQHWFAGRKLGQVVRSSLQTLSLRAAPRVGRHLLSALVSVKLGGVEVRYAMPTVLDHGRNSTVTSV